MRSSLIYLIIAFVVLAGLTGCAPRPQPVVERPKVPSQDEWITMLADRTKAWQSYQARAHIAVESPKGKFNFKAVILAGLPGRYRLEAFNPFGQTVSLLVLNRDRRQSSLFIPAEKVLYTAAKAETLVAHFLGVPIPLETFGYSLIACVSPEHLSRIMVASQGGEWLGHSKSPTRGPTFTWKFLPQPPALESMEVQEGPWRYSIVYESAVALSPQSVPEKIKFQSSQWKMEVTLDQIQGSPALQDSAFSPPIPSGIHEVDLDKMP